MLAVWCFESVSIAPAGQIGVVFQSLLVKRNGISCLFVIDVAVLYCVLNGFLQLVHQFTAFILHVAENFSHGVPFTMDCTFAFPSLTSTCTA